MMNLPNVLTLLRILMIPVFIVVFYLPFWWAHLAAAIIFALGCVTDWLDGYFARSLKQFTRLGAFLDPVADKLMVSIALVMIIGETEFQFITWNKSTLAIPVALLTVPAAIIVGREIIVSALREWMAELGKRTSVAVSHLGKVKTTIQMIALIVLIYCDASTHAYIVISGYVLLYVAALLTLWSMFIYVKAAWPDLRAE